MAVEDAKQAAIDEKEDVTKRTGGAAMASFYGNLNKNVAMGGQDHHNNNNKQEEDKKAASSSSKKEDQDQAEGSASEGGGGGGGMSKQGWKPATSKSDSSSKKKVQLDPVTKNREMRKAREEKLAKARIRYFERNGMPPPTIRGN